MCGRYQLTKVEQLKSRFEASFSELDEGAFAPLYNIAPTDAAPVIVQDGTKRLIRRMNFGLIPHWATDPKIGVSCLNARAETVADKPAFRESFRRRRCLVPTDGFFEWQKVGKSKQPYRFTLKGDGVFAFAGLWDTWKRPDGNSIETFSIVTTTPNSFIERFHDRMPVILAKGDESVWLAPTVNKPEAVLPLLRPYNSAEMVATRVSTEVNSAANKSPDVATPVVNEPVEEQRELF